MTAFKAILKDEEIAAVLTFVRNTWGNQASMVTPDQVKAVREVTRDVQMFIKPEELLKEYPLEK
jgi:mono/diheme cytochrome c family protein